MPTSFPAHCLADQKLQYSQLHDRCWLGMSAAAVLVSTRKSVYFAAVLHSGVFKRWSPRQPIDASREFPVDGGGVD
jgi:hypothetical protein